MDLFNFHTHSTSLLCDQLKTVISPAGHDCSTHQSPDQTPPSSILDVVIIGAGPHALSIVAKLLDQTDELLEELPSNTSLFKQKTTACNNSTQVFCLHPKTIPSKLTLPKDQIEKMIISAQSSKAKHESIMKRVTVIDRSGNWLQQWNAQFSALEIEYLRSAINAHPCPIDQRMMQHHARVKNLDVASSFRSIDLMERCDDFHGPFLVPSTRFFFDFCQSVIQRYHLEDKVKKAEVSKISIISSESAEGKNSKWVQVTMQDGRQISCHKLIVATGSLNVPVWPAWAISAKNNLKSVSAAGEQMPISQAPTILHSTDILRQPSLGNIASRSTAVQHRLLIVGGGLTAAHLALRAVRQGSKVVLAMRGSLKIKQFDLDLKWMSNLRTANLAKFWTTPIAARPQMLRQAKGGGSISPEIMEALEPFILNDQVEIRTHTEVEWAEWSEEDARWNVQFSHGHRDYSEDTFQQIWLATGSDISLESDPILSHLYKTHPCKTVAGFPVLTPDLQWAEDIPVFVVGERAALELGPGAVNLMGARAGAARVAKVIKPFLEDKFNSVMT